MSVRSKSAGGEKQDIESSVVVDTISVERLRGTSIVDKWATTVNLTVVQWGGVDRFTGVNPQVVSSLNGIHGEFTNSDDVKNGKMTSDELNEFRRLKKEADNKMRGQIIGMRKHGGKNSTKQDTPVSPPVCEVKPPNVKVVPFAVPGYGYIYLDYTDKKGILRPYIECDEYSRIDEGVELGSVVYDNYGYYRVEEGKGRLFVTSSPFSERYTTTHSIQGRITDNRGGLVFLPLLTKLWSEFKSSKVSQTMENSYQMAVKNVVSQAKTMLDQSLPSLVVEWFCSVCDTTEAIYKLKVLANYSDSNKNNNMFLPTAIAKHTDYVIHTGVVNCITSKVIPKDLLDVRYPIKPNIKILRNSEKRDLTEEFWFDEKPWPVDEIPDIEDMPGEGQYTSVWANLADFIRFRSKGKGSENNLYGAMKRIFGGRELEEEYQLAQANLCTVLANQYPAYTHLLTKMNVLLHRQSVHDTSLVEVNVLGLPVHHNFTNTLYSVDQYPYLVDSLPMSQPHHLDVMKNSYRLVLEVLDHLTSLVAPTIQETVVDVSMNLVNFCKTKIYTYVPHLIPSCIWRRQFADEPHAKRLERQRMEGGVLRNGTGCLVNKVAVNVKDEIAKNGGKMPRAFVSYGEGVLCAPGLPETMKERINGWHYFDINGLELLIIIYAKPKTSELVRLFEALITARMQRKNHLCVAIYSDDSCYSGVINGIPFGYNVDISSCDSSNGPPIFFATIMMLSKISPYLAEQLLEQCMKPMKVVHPVDKQYSFELLLPTAFEGSGTVLTTCLNHIASAMIAASVAQQLSRAVLNSEKDVEICIIRGAALVGHKVTTASIEVDGVLQPSRFQFLKISPMLCTHRLTGESRLVPVRNIGSIIKGFGKLTQDMQAVQLGISNSAFNAMTFSERFDNFFGAVIQGYKNEPATPLLTALRTRFSTTQGTLAEKYSLVENDLDFSDYIVDEIELTRRYGLLNYNDTCQTLLELKLGDDCHRDPVLEKMMIVDYEYVSRSYSIDF